MKKAHAHPFLFHPRIDISHAAIVSNYTVRIRKETYLEHSIKCTTKAVVRFQFDFSINASQQWITGTYHI